jgi:hypothetical protein
MKTFVLAIALALESPEAQALLNTLMDAIKEVPVSSRRLLLRSPPRRRMLCPLGLVRSVASTSRASCDA